MSENTYSHGASQFVNGCDGLMRPFVVTTYIQKILFYMSSLSLKHSNIFIFFASAQSDQGPRCPLTELLDTIECINGKQKPV